MIDNPRAPRVRRVASLARKKDRFVAGQFLVEGPQAVKELLVHEPDLVRVVYTTMGDEPWQIEIARLADAAGVESELVTDDVLLAMADTVQPQGVVAVAEMTQVSLQSIFENAKLVAIMHEVRDPGNAGAVLRAADAAGADAVVFSGESIDPWHPKVVRSTTGSLFHLPVATASTLEMVVVAARDAGLRVCAADVSGCELDPSDHSLSEPTAWVFGNEARGLSAEALALTEQTVRLPIYGKAQSLNLATAASVCLYATAFAQHNSVTRGAAPAAS